VKKVLIIGETAASEKLLKKHLASLGYTVVGAVTNGRDAVNTARESRPDVILMDIDIPGEFGGAQAASQIARELDIPVIVIADQADDEVIAKARDAGARGFLLKPVEPRQLKAAVEIAVGSKGTQTEFTDRFHDLIENTNDLVYITDGKGNIRYANNRVSESLGYAYQDIIGKSFKDLVNPRLFKDASEIFSRQLKGEDVGAFEIELVDRDGGIKTIETRETLKWEKGRIVEVYGIGRDITIRKHAEEALKESEEKYRDIFESAIEGIYQTTPEGRFVSINPSFAQILGFDTPEELISATTDISRQFYVDSNRRVEFQDLLSRYGKITNFEAQLYRRDGSAVWVTTDAKAVTDESGTARLYQGVILDISKRKNAEEALRQSEEKFRNLFETSRDVVYISTVEGRFLDINPAAEETFGYTREELLTINVRDLYKDPRQREQFKSAVAERGFVKYYEVQMKRKDGTIIDCLITGTVRRDPEGAIVGYQGIIRDITERLRLRRQVIQTEKLSSLGAMISGVAHEINNPLTSIIGNAQLLMRKDIPPDFRTKLEVIKRESVRCTKIVAGLLSFAREHRPERCMTDVNAVVVESLRLKEYDLNVNNVRVVMDLAGDLPHTSADPYQLQQVFINLINNSHDALREKGGGRLSIRSFLKDSSICVVFADDGPGIEPGDLNRIFDPFFTTKDVGKGTGLGLSVAYGIINEHGGTIDVESRPGKGAEFAVRIPFIESPSTEDNPDRID
jgi:PAS domain S-box-containing protein